MPLLLLTQAAPCPHAWGPSRIRGLLASVTNMCYLRGVSTALALKCPACQLMAPPTDQCSRIALHRHACQALAGAPCPANPSYRQALALLVAMHPTGGALRSYVSCSKTLVGRPAQPR